MKNFKNKVSLFLIEKLIKNQEEIISIIEFISTIIDYLNL